MKYAAYQTANGLGPKELSKGIPISVNLGNANTPKLVQLTHEEMSGVMAFVQAIWIDNSLNPDVFVVEIPILGQIIRAAAFSQGVYPVFSIMPFEAKFSSPTADISIPIILLNMPQPYFVW